MNSNKMRKIILSVLFICALSVMGESDEKGFKSIFNGKDFTGWSGPLDNYQIVDGAIQCKKGKGGTIFTKDVYANFVVRFEFKVPPGGNNGLAIRYPGSGNTAYGGMCELQVLDDNYEKVRKAKLDPCLLYTSPSPRDA